MTRVALFDWTAGGHRPVYVRRFVDALTEKADVILALPDETLAAVGRPELETISLGSPRPALTSWRQRRSVLAEEVARFHNVASSVDRTLHLFADHAIFQLASAEKLHERSTSLLLFYPRAHYADLYGTRLPLSDRPVALAKEWAIRRWRARKDAGTIFTLDEELAARWNGQPGARAVWLPEPPVAVLPRDKASVQREGCVLYGALAKRKGIDLLARALLLRRTPLKVTFAGEIDPPQYAAELEMLVSRLRRHGTDVVLRSHLHTELEGLEILASARCAVLPYRRHPGMSRVLVEACSVGTPVVVDHFGLVGHLVRRHGLGLAVNAEDSRALHDAVVSLSDEIVSASFAPALARFALHFSPERFSASLLGGLEIERSGSSG